MALKGSAKIELVNADGTKEVVEHGNMITDAVADLLYCSRGEQSNIMRISNNGDSLVENIFGGILLFKDNLSEDAADYYIPSVNTTGYASVSAYSGMDIERGSFNSVESGLQEDGSYRLVWDFATSQANGVISAIGLCPNMMGKIGMSNTIVSSESVVAVTTRSSLLPYNSDYGWMYSVYGYNIVAVIGDIAYAVFDANLSLNRDNTEAHIKNNGGFLKLYRFKICSSSVSLCSKAGVATLIDIIDVPVPSEFLDKTYAFDCSYDEVGKRLILYYIAGIGRLSPNASMYYAEIEIENNMNVALRTFTNNSPYEIDIESSNNVCSQYGSYGNIFITKDYVVTKCSTNGSYKFYVTNKNDNTDIKEVKWENGNEFAVTEAGVARPIFTCGNLFVFGFSENTQYTDFTSSYVLDMSTGLLKRTNAYRMTYRNNIPLANKVTWGKTGTCLGLSITVNPFILTTKNNLDAPVTKTASQTMKITYTLTDV